jgi:hypothetical protein
VEIHCAARCSRDQNPLNSNGNLHYFVGTGIGGWFAGTMLETRFASHSNRYWAIRSRRRCARARPRDRKSWRPMQSPQDPRESGEGTATSLAP